MVLNRPTRLLRPTPRCPLAALREGGRAVESLSLRAASQRLHTTTLFGWFHVDPVNGLQTGHQIRVVESRRTAGAGGLAAPADVSVESTSARGSGPRPGASGRIAGGGKFGLWWRQVHIGT